MDHKMFKALRNYHGYSQKSYGELLGVSESNIALIENGKRNITYAMKTKIARHFEITPEFLEFLERMEALE